MGDDDGAPFRGSQAVREGRASWTVLAGPRYRWLGPDTYVAAGVETDAVLRVRAALVHAGPEAVAIGWSAVLLRGLDVAPAVMPVEIAAFGRHLRHPEVTFRRQRLRADEIDAVDGLRATTPLRTAFDLATRCELDDAVVAADALARRGRFTASGLRAFAAERPGARGVRNVDRVAALMDPGAASRPETRARLLLVRAGLPPPVTQHPVANEFGWEFAWLDLAWPAYRVGVEYDGKDHAQADRRGRDLDRLEDIRREGWIVIVLTARQLHQPARTAGLVRDALRSRGWSPAP